VNQKPSYIRIGSISEIDPNKLSISQIQQKFVDSENNRYSLRFNKDSKRIEILKVLPNQEFELVNSGISSAEKPPIEKKSLESLLRETLPEEKPKPITQESTQSSFNKRAHFRDKKEPLIGEDVDLDVFSESPSRVSSPSQTSSESTKMIQNRSLLRNRDIAEQYLDIMSAHRERLEYILLNLKNSKIFEITGDPSENKNIIGNFQREIDLQVFQEIEKATRTHQEMQSFPRPITYYMSKASHENREKAKDLATDKDRLDFLYSIEMKRNILHCLQLLKTFSTQLISLINIKSETQVKQLLYQNQILFVDSKTAAIFYTQELDGILSECQKWTESNA